MSAGSIILIAVVIILIVFIGATALGISQRRRRLRERFGPEYDRVVAERQSRRLAEAELDSRERRIQKLFLQDLSADARDRFERQWSLVQEQFVETPAEAVTDAQSLIEAVMRERGYPVADYEQTVADLSVEHARVIDDFRSAHAISVRAASGQARTEDLRVAMLYYRELFEQLLAPETADETDGSDPAEPEPPATAASRSDPTEADPVESDPLETDPVAGRQDR